MRHASTLPRHAGAGPVLAAGRLAALAGAALADAWQGLQSVSKANVLDGVRKRASEAAREGGEISPYPMKIRRLP